MRESWRRPGLHRIHAAHLTDEAVPHRDPAVFGTPPPDAHLVRH
ncbi:hypothetical protein [Modestobacter altitudinis]|nr:hypothetical protein [Modestobacter altitudinis]